MKILLNPKYEKIIIPFISILLGMTIGMIIMLIVGYNPFVAYGQMITGVFGSVYNIGEWLVIVTPILLTGLSVSFAYRAGLFNIGAEGQFIVGSFAAVYVGSFDLPFLIAPIAAITAAMAAGALWGFVPGALKAIYGVHEVVVTIMMNWIAHHLVNWLILEKFHVEGATTKTPYVTENANLSMPWLSDLFNGARVHWGIFLAVIAVVVFWWIMEKTTFGYEVKAVGHNKTAALYAGMKEKKRIIQTMMISGAFAGLGGATYSIGTFSYLTTAGTFRNFGFDGIAVALLGAATPIGTFFSALLIGGLRTGSRSMIGIPTEIADIIIALIILFSGMSYVFSKMIIKQRRKRGEK